MSSEALVKEYSRNFPDDTDGQDLIRDAYTFAKETHKGHKRASGEDYMIHLYETALQLARWKLDAVSVVAGLLHDTVEDCGADPKELEKQFGSQVRFLVDGVTKLGTLKYLGPDEQNAGTLRKMMLAISKDLRVVFVKLSDRLHNMLTLQFIPKEKQRRIAMETVEIYSPLASRLGMQNLSGRLEDLAFPYLHPKEYTWLSENVKEPYEARNRYLKKVEPVVRKELSKAGVIPVRIDYRAKRLYSLYKKLHRYDMNLDQIYDLIALRIIVRTIPECYTTLGTIHHLWPPLPGRIKDYIALPKPNGYQSLHTTVFSLQDRPAEFQIRTIAMHDHAENGAAAHWFYETNKSSKLRSLLSATTLGKGKELEWVKQLKSWQQTFPGSKEFLEAIKVDLFSDRIFILTPKGRVVDLPIGSTPVDFAYKIHTDVGNSCTGAKINDKIAPLDTTLQSGDVVEILTQKSKRPSESWVHFAKTAQAKKKIRNRINQSRRSLTKKIDFRIIGKDRIGIFKDISSVFSRNHISLTTIETLKAKGMPMIKVIAELKTIEKADDIVKKLKKIDGVKDASYRIIRPDIIPVF